MGTEGAPPIGGYFGAEFTTHERIRYVQSQIRIAIQNHHLLYTRLQAFPKDTDIENHMRILQDLILSLGRTQLELMYQFKTEIKAKHDASEIQNVMTMSLGWPDRFEMPLYNGKENGNVADKDKTPNLIAKKGLVPKKKPVLAQPSQKPKVRMQSLLKVNHSKQCILPSRKESERLKAAASKYSETPYSILKEAKKLQSVLKATIDKRNQSSSDGAKQLNETSEADNDLKESTFSESTRIEDRATALDQLTQDSYLHFFGLVHKDKSKKMVVTQTKRKRRSAAGQTSFYGDFSYQAKRVYTKRAAVPASVPQSPSSSQDVADTDENDRLSLTSTDKPSEPASPEIPSSQEVVDSQETTDETGSSRELATPQEASTTSNTQEIDSSQDIVAPQVVSASPEAPATREPTLQDVATSELPTSQEVVDVKQDLKDSESTKESDQPNRDDDVNSEGTEPLTPSDDMSHSPLVNPDNDKLQEPQENSQPQDITEPLSQAEQPDENSANEDVSDEESATEILLNYCPSTRTVEEVVKPTLNSSPTAEDPNTVEESRTTSKSHPNNKSQDSETSHTAKTDETCSICLERSDAKLEKCDDCDDVYHKDCTLAPNGTCPSCPATPTTISSIVGVNKASTLTSTDCSEVIKRYLDDMQGSPVTGDVSEVISETRDSNVDENHDKSPDDVVVDNTCKDDNSKDLDDSTGSGNASNAKNDDVEIDNVAKERDDDQFLDADLVFHNPNLSDDDSLSSSLF